MDPRELDADEASVRRVVTSWLKANRDWMTRTEILQPGSADRGVIAEQQLAGDGRRFVVFRGRGDSSTHIAPRPPRLTGLDPEARYRNKLLNRAGVATGSRGEPALNTAPLDLGGQDLISHGVILPCSFPLGMWVIEGRTP